MTFSGIPTTLRKLRQVMGIRNKVSTQPYMHVWRKITLGLLKGASRIDK